MKIIVRAIAAFALLGCAPLAAQDWPNKPIRMIVPFAAGGSTDVAARLVAENLSRSLGQQVVVENRTGANGNIGTEAAAKSAPDGYTLLVAPEAVTSNLHVYKVNYELKDLAPVIQLSRQPVLLAAHPTLGIKTIAELIAHVKKNPGERFATGSGTNSGQHMVTLWFAKLAGIELEQVSYRGGGQAINDLLAGHVKLGTLGSTPLIPHYRAGKLLLLAQTTAARAASLPDVPTFQEVGHERPGVRPMARRVRAGRDAAADRGAAQRRDRQGALRSGDQGQSGEVRTGADRRHGRGVRQARQRRLREV